MKDTPKFAAAVAVLGAALLMVQVLSQAEAVPIRKPLGLLPARIGEWQQADSSELGEKELGLLKLSDYALRHYRDASGRSLWLYVGYWDTQRRGAQIHSPRHCLPGGGWEPLQAERTVIDVARAGDRAQIHANRFVMQRQADTMAVLYWYEAQGQTTASEFEAKVLMVQNSLLHNRSDGALVRITAPIQGSLPQTWELLQRFVAELDPALRNHLPE